MAECSIHCLPTCPLLFGKYIYPSLVRFLSIPRQPTRVAWAALKWLIHQIGKFPFPVNTSKKNQLQLQRKLYMWTNSLSLYQRLHRGSRDQGGGGGKLKLQNYDTLRVHMLKILYRLNNTKSVAIDEHLRPFHTEVPPPSTGKGRDCAKARAIASKRHMKIEFIVACRAPLALS